MTEIKEFPQLNEGLQRLVLHWGEMGSTWGVNRSVAQVHALLFVSEEPLTAEQIAAMLAMARSNVSNSLKELLSWSLIRRVQVLGDRRDYFEAEADMFEMVRAIAIGRKAREIEPTLAVVQDCVLDAERDRRMSPVVRKRLADMQSMLETVDKSFDEIIRLPSPTLRALIRMGGAIARFVGQKPKRAIKKKAKAA